MADLGLSTVVSARTGLLATELSDTERVMLDVDQGTYFGVENVANTIWKAIAEPQTVRQICEVVLANYDAQAPQVEADTKSFLSRLIEAGLVVCHPDAN